MYLITLTYILDAALGPKKSILCILILIASEVINIYIMRNKRGLGFLLENKTFLLINDTGGKHNIWTS